MSDHPSPTPPPSPAEEPSAAEIAAAGAIRPLEELPSPFEIVGNPPMVSEPDLRALSPEDRKIVIERASGSRNPDALDEALHGFLVDRSKEFRLKAGAGEGATETEREALSQMNSLRLLGGEIARIDAALAEVRDAALEHDADGNPVAVPIYVLQGNARTGWQARRAEAVYEMSLVAGIQGEAALSRAARADALRARRLQSAAYEAGEIKRRAHEMAQEDRINTAARTRAKFLKGSDG